MTNAERSLDEPAGTPDGATLARGWLENSPFVARLGIRIRIAAGARRGELAADLDREIPELDPVRDRRPDPRLAAIGPQLRTRRPELLEELAELEPHRQGRIIVHCHHGGRSLQVAQYLLKQGFTQVQNLSGGIDAWSQTVDPAVPRY